MASIKELPRWEDEVYQIARGDKVEGGVGGIANMGNDSNLLIVFYVQIVPDDFVMQLHRF